MTKSILIGIFIIAPTFYLIGRWLEKSTKDDKEKTDNSQKQITSFPKENENFSLKESIRTWFFGVGIIFAIGGILYFLFWLDSWDRLSPEEKERVERQKQLYLQDIKHCQAAVDSENINNAEFQRCVELLQDFNDNNIPNSDRGSGIYEY